MTTETKAEALAVKKGRIDRANAALREYVKVCSTQYVADDAPGEFLAEYLIDLLADLRHWSAHNGVNYDDIDRQSAGHFQDEQKEVAAALGEGGDGQ